MILDKLSNLARYSSENFDLTALKTFLNSPETVKFQPGKFDINEPKLFGIGLEYETKKAEDCLWEAHRKYLDIHVIWEGQEYVQLNDIDNMKSSKSYESEGDYELFEGNKQHEILLQEGLFLILFPNEIHKTSIAKDEVSKVKKTVFKIALHD